MADIPLPVIGAVVSLVITSTFIVALIVARIAAFVREYL